jgi:serine kinase of HPr protein (carbohydrate metabolism regulator)
MTINEAAALLGAEICQGEFEDTELKGAYTSDLLSDVMANAREGNALITIQAHKNTVAIASQMKIPVIIICNSREIPEDMLEAAKDEGIGVFRCGESQFDVSGKLWEVLKEGDTPCAAY